MFEKLVSKGVKLEDERVRCCSCENLQVTQHSTCPSPFHTGVTEPNGYDMPQQAPPTRYQSL